MNNQKGFTLIELMVSMVIGLIVVAAVGQVYVMAIRTGSTQKAAANILDSNVYGLQQIERHLRLAGLDLGNKSYLNSACSGVLIAKDIGSVKQCADITGATDGTTNESPIVKLPINQWTSVSAAQSNANGNIRLPQLTIQYRAPEDMYDCEGKLALGPRQVVGQSAERSSFSATPTPAGGKAAATPQIDVGGQVVVERYFVKRNGSHLELRCDAGRYVPEWIKSETRSQDPKVTAAQITDQAAPNMQQALARAIMRDMGDDGALVVSDIDHFEVLLGIKKDKKLRYYTIADYMALSSPSDTAIVAVKLGILSTGSIATPQNANQPQVTAYKVLGKDITMPTNQAPALRRVYETTVVLRNSRGES